MESVEKSTRSRPILSVLGPIAQKILELKVTRNGAICDAQMILQLTKQCESFELSCNRLKDFVIIEAKKLKDKALASEIEDLHRNIIWTIKDLGNATKDLHRGDVGVRDIQDVWKDLIFHSEALLEGLTKMLLAWDRIQLQKIYGSLNTFHQSLQSLKETHFHHLHQAFQDVVNKAGDVLYLIDERRNDIYKKHQRETLVIGCLQFKQLLKLLSHVIVDSSRNRLCKDAKATRDCVLLKFENLIDVFRREIDLGSQDYELQDSGTYINNLNTVFNTFIVAPGTRSVEKLPVLNSLKNSLETVLQHCICVAQSVSADDQTIIMTACEDVLHQMKVLSDTENTVYPDPNDVDVIFDVIVDVLENLEEEVNSSLIKLIVQAFTDPFSILEELVKEAKQLADLGDDSPPSQVQFEKFDKLTSEFEEEVDRFYQIAGFVISCINDSQKVRQIEASLATLSWIESGLLASTLQMSRAQRDSPKGLHKTRVLSQEWVNEVVRLRRHIYSLLEPSALFHATKQEILKIWIESRKLAEIKSQRSKFGTLHKNVRRVVCLTHRILKTNEDCRFLNEDRANELEIALNEFSVLEDQIVRSGENCMKEDVLRFVKRLRCLLTTFDKIMTRFPGKTSGFLNTRPEISSNQEFLKDMVIPQDQTPEISDRPYLLTSISQVPLDITNKDSSSFTVNTKTENGNEPKGPLGSLQSIFRPKSLQSVETFQRRARDTSKRIDKSNIDSSDIKSSRINQSRDRNVSIDITKFLLSRSSHLFRNSTRSSKRNFSLKVKEIDLDIGEVVKITPKVNAPRYIPPSNEYTQDNSLDGFTEILHRMDQFANSISMQSNSVDEKNQQTFSGKSDKPTVDKHELFYHTFHPLLQQTDNEKSEANSSKKEILTNRNNKENIPLNIINHQSLKTKENTEEKENRCLQITNNSPNNEVGDSFHRSSMFSDAPSSLNISTPQRLDDLKKVQNKLEILRF